MYLSLYESYKEIKEERQAKKWGDYEIEVLNGVKDILNNYQSVDEKNSKIPKPIRVSKNGKTIGFAKKKSEEQNKEKVQNVPNKFEPLSLSNQQNEIELDENPEWIIRIKYII